MKSELAIKPLYYNIMK